MNIQKKQFDFVKIFEFYKDDELITIKCRYRTDSQTGLCVKMHKNGSLFDTWCHKHKGFDYWMKFHQCENAHELCQILVLNQLTQIFKITREQIFIKQGN